MRFNVSEQSKPSNIWFYLKEGLFGDSEQGPFDLATMHQLMDLGEISLETKLRSPTRTNNAWTEAKYVQEIADKITTAQFAKEKRHAKLPISTLVVVGVAIFTCWLINAYSVEANTALGLDSILPEDSTFSEIILQTSCFFFLLVPLAWGVVLLILVFEEYCTKDKKNFTKDGKNFTKDENEDGIATFIMELSLKSAIIGMFLAMLSCPIHLIEWWFE
jgi:hypothetical protein